MHPLQPPRKLLWRLGLQQPVPSVLLHQGPEVLRVQPPPQAHAREAAPQLRKRALDLNTERRRHHVSPRPGQVPPDRHDRVGDVVDGRDRSLPVRVEPRRVAVLGTRPARDDDPGRLRATALHLRTRHPQSTCGQLGHQPPGGKPHGQQPQRIGFAPKLMHGFGPLLSGSRARSAPHSPRPGPPHVWAPAFAGRSRA